MVIISKKKDPNILSTSSTPLPVSSVLHSSSLCFTCGRRVSDIFV